MTLGSFLNFVKSKNTNKTAGAVSFAAQRCTCFHDALPCYRLAPHTCINVYRRNLHSIQAGSTPIEQTLCNCLFKIRLGQVIEDWGKWNILLILIYNIIRLVFLPPLAWKKRAFISIIRLYKRPPYHLCGVYIYWQFDIDFLI